MKRKIPEFGYIAESDILSLSADLSLRGNILFDSACGLNHQLNPDASQSLQLLSNRSSYGEWLHAMRKLELTNSNIYEILEFINKIGGLEVHKNHNSRILSQMYYFKDLVTGLPLQRLSYRYKANFIGLAIACWRASFSFFIGAILSTILLLASGLVGFEIWTYFSFFIALVFISFITHEYTHVLTLKRLGAKGFVLQKGIRLAVVHAKLIDDIEIRLALLGPLAGIVSSMSLGLLGLVLFGGSKFLAIGFIVSVFHFISWLPFYGDGETLFKSMKRR